MHSNLIDKISLNKKFTLIKHDEKKAIRHKIIQAKFKRDYDNFQKSKRLKLKHQEQKNNHYQTLKAIAKIVGITLK
jgi:hypothetical protein